MRDTDRKRKPGREEKRETFVAKTKFASRLEHEAE